MGSAGNHIYLRDIKDNAHRCAILLAVIWAGTWRKLAFCGGMIKWVTWWDRWWDWWLPPENWSPAGIEGGLAGR